MPFFSHSLLKRLRASSKCSASLTLTKTINFFTTFYGYIAKNGRGFFPPLYYIKFKDFFHPSAGRPVKAPPGHQVEVQMVHALPGAFAVIGYQAEIL